MAARNIYSGPVAGVTFEPAKTNIISCFEEYERLGRPQVILELEHDPDNPHDCLAIRVIATVLGGSERWFIGHIPRYINAELHENNLGKLRCTFREFLSTGRAARISVELPNQIPMLRGKYQINKLKVRDMTIEWVEEHSRAGRLKTLPYLKYLVIMNLRDRIIGIVFPGVPPRGMLVTRDPDYLSFDGFDDVSEFFHWVDWRRLGEIKDEDRDPDLPGEQKCQS